MKKVAISQSINIKHVLRSKAIDNKNFDLYERVPFLTEEEAIEILKELQNEDPSWAYDYTDSEGLIEYEDGSGKIGEKESEAPVKKPGTPINPEDLQYWKKIEKN